MKPKYQTCTVLLLLAGCGAVPPAPEPPADASPSTASWPDAATQRHQEASVDAPETDSAVEPEAATCRPEGSTCGAEGLAPCCPGLACADFCR